MPEVRPFEGAFENPGSNPWYALHVRSRHEKTVAAQLEAKQQTVFLPLYESRNRWRDRWKTVELPLFPGYVFCQVPPGYCSQVIATSGVIDVVRVGSEPAAVAPHEIDMIKVVAASRLPVEPYPNLAVGETVVIQSGPLAGVTGTLIEVRNNLRLVVSVEILCRSVQVQIDRGWAVPLKTHAAGAPRGR